MPQCNLRFSFLKENSHHLGLCLVYDDPESDARLAAKPKPRASNELKGIGSFDLEGSQAVRRCETDLTEAQAKPSLPPDAS
jgi:hypothetical protein